MGAVPLARFGVDDEQAGSEQKRGSGRDRSERDGGFILFFDLDRTDVHHRVFGREGDAAQYETEETAANEKDGKNARDGVKHGGETMGAGRPEVGPDATSQT